MIFLCITLASLGVGIGIYGELAEQRRLARMARDCKAQGEKS